jgi:UDP-glucose 4-epimerase
VVRLFNTVGPRQTGQYGMVLPTFVKQALAGQPITVYGDGTQSRCFGYVGDVVGALMNLMDHSDAVGQVFNIGSDEEVTIAALAELVKTTAVSSSAIVYVPYSEAYEVGFEDMPRRIPDVSKVRQLIGFKPTRSLREIVELVIDYHAASLAHGESKVVSDTSTSTKGR